MTDRKTKLTPRNYHVSIVEVSWIGEEHSEKVEVVEIPSRRIFEKLFRGMEVHTYHRLGTRFTF